MTLPLILQAGGSTGLLMDLAANEKAVHADFFNGKWVPGLVRTFLCRGQLCAVGNLDHGTVWPGPCSWQLALPVSPV